MPVGAFRPLLGKAHRLPRFRSVAAMRPREPLQLPRQVQPVGHPVKFEAKEFTLTCTRQEGGSDPRSEAVVLHRLEEPDTIFRVEDRHRCGLLLRLVYESSRVAGDTAVAHCVTEGEGQHPMRLLRRGATETIGKQAVEQGATASRTNTAESAASPQQHHFGPRTSCPRPQSDPRGFSGHTASHHPTTPLRVYFGYSRRHSKLATGEVADRKPLRDCTPDAREDRPRARSWKYQSSDAHVSEGAY